MTPDDIRRVASTHGHAERLQWLLEALADVVETGRTYVAVFGDTEQSDIAAFRFDQALACVQALAP